MTEDELVKFVEQQYGPALELRVTDAAVLPPAAPASPPSTTSSRGDRSVLRRRLENFYRSQQVADYQDKVEYALRLDADDDIIMEKVMQKYSVTQEPPPTASSDSHQQPPTDSRSLLGFTQQPPRASSPPPPPPPDPPGAVSPGQSMSDGLPSLERKRSVTFSDLGRDAGDDATNKRREHLKTRLTAFYQRFNPGNIDKVELALTLDIPEDILFSKLYEKYNLDQNGEPLEVGGAFNRFEGGSGGSPTRSSVFLPSGLPPLPPGALPTTTSAGQPQSPTTVERQNFMTTRKALEDRLFVIYAKNFTSAEAMERSQRVAMLPGESVDDAVARVVKEQEQHGVDAPLLQRVNSVASTLAQQRQPSSSEPLPEGASLHERLTKFYEVHRPSEVSRVEAVLSSGVTEEQVWERLAERYGDDAVAPFRSNAAREMGSRGAHPQPADFTDDVLSRLVSMRSTGTAAAPPRSSSRRSPDPPLSGSALDQLVDRVAEESEDPLVALDRATGHRNAPSLPMRYSVAAPDIQPSTSRAVSFLLRLPDVSMYLIQRAAVQQRADFAVSLERDVRGFAQVNGAVAVACETKLSPDDDSVAMQYVALFPTAVGAARFRTLGASSALVPLPATRAAYLLLGGNVHSVKEGRISGAVFAANIPQSLLVSPPQAAPPATSSALAAREAGGGAQQTDINYYEPVVVPDESYSAHNVVDAAARQQSVDGASPMLASLRLRHQRGGHQDISPPKATTAALFTAEDEQHAGDDAREGSREVAPLSKSWGQLLGQQQGMGTTPAAVREQDIQARERSLQAQSIELKDRQRVLQEREAMLRDGELRIRAAQDEERETNRLRRERAAEASMRFESLAIRETEVKERERQLARRQDAITDRERTLDSRASELEQRVAMLDERERRVTLRERQLDEIAPSRAINGSAAGQHGGEPEMAYMADLEKKLREARQRIAVLEGAPSSAVALHAQQQSSTTQSRDMDMRLRHVIEREALVADSEARLERKSHSAMAEVRHDDDNARRRWEELRRQDRELLARRLEIEAVHTSVQRQQAVAASSHSAASTSPQQSSPPGLGSSSRITAASTASVHTAQRSLFTSPQTDATPPPPLNSSFSFHASRDVTSATLLRQDDISTMLNRVKEREKMIRSMSERMTPVRSTNSNWGGSHQF
ncbi:Hypothetical protein, putative [Bodo saltans]|uniref:Uncharacterized protein n=1 Tax=Bodo saltans TaxID=75058 RepID=A0A0S4JJW3_BODSA|nr:Hypothetical protein, putative [Bodo saltans]|eukprot:CUG88776.1 Hypothetical protein, putative [Bodo saltans]